MSARAELLEKVEGGVFRARGAADEVTAQVRALLALGEARSRASGGWPWGLLLGAGGASVGFVLALFGCFSLGTHPAYLTGRPTFRWTCFGLAAACGVVGWWGFRRNARAEREHAAAWGDVPRLEGARLAIALAALEALPSGSTGLRVELDVGAPDREHVKVLDLRATYPGKRAFELKVSSSERGAGETRLHAWLAVPGDEEDRRELLRVVRAKLELPPEAELLEPGALEGDRLHVCTSLNGRGSDLGSGAPLLGAIQAAASGLTRALLSAEP
ncbi:MAG: hypothetical protein AB7N76_31610 [Planctomycetota bacterium]